MSPQPPREPTASSSLEELRLNAHALFATEESGDLESLVADKIDGLRHYDVPAMDKVASIVMWGRSGTLLLCSYMDGHDDVIVLPELCGEPLYEFFERYKSLSLHDKLIGYPCFRPDCTRFFEGDFAISRMHYYAAVQAIVASCNEWPAEFVESRRAFFLFLHIAYNLARGVQPATSRPLIVYTQHYWDPAAASHLVKDFPQAKFVHAIRDPISSCDALFQFHLKAVERNPILPFSALEFLVGRDRPHPGMESRTRAIRFEDLHSDTAATMRDLVEWLGLPYHATLIHSTFNGIPWVVKRGEISWSGRRLGQVQRRSQALSAKDRALMFALFYENFAEWNYPCPEIFRDRFLRCLVFAGLILFPTKMELLAARAIGRQMVLPALWRGNLMRVAKCLLSIGFCRLRIVQLLVPPFLSRCLRRPDLLQIHRRNNHISTQEITTGIQECSEGAAISAAD